jgi:bifunctional non-homologous end joining protein LigD
VGTAEPGQVYPSKGWCQVKLLLNAASDWAFACYITTALRVLSAILIYTVSPQFQPMPLLKRPAPFDDPAWVFELKYDGFRALAVIEHGRAELISGNGYPFASFSALAESISDCLPNTRAVIDGEICSLDRRGKPQFKNLLFRRGNRNPPCFFAFDLLTYDRKDLRTERLLDRKQELRRLLARAPADSPLKYTEYIDGSGRALFQRACELDLEGIVAKHKFGPYTDRENSTWVQDSQSRLLPDGGSGRTV